MLVLLIISYCLHHSMLGYVKCLSNASRLRVCGLLITSTFKYKNHYKSKGKGREAAISC